MQKINNFDLLFNINVRMAFNKKSIITICLSVFILILYLVFISYNSYDPKEYLISYKDIHYIYFKDGLFVVNIINSLISMILISILFVNSDSFDSMYVSYIPRNIICRSKICSLIYLGLIMIIIEYFLLILVAFLIFPYYKIELSNLYMMGYVIIYWMIQVGITIIFLSIMNNSFIPMLGFIISFLLQILGLAFKEELYYIEYIAPTNFMEFDIPYITLIAFAFSIIFYKLKFSIKNIN